MPVRGAQRRTFYVRDDIVQRPTRGALGETGQQAVARRDCAPRMINAMPDNMPVSMGMPAIR